MIVGRYNALEISGGVARRFGVDGAALDAGAIVRAELAEEPAETLRLPLPRDVARDWLLLHFEDLRFFVETFGFGAVRPMNHRVEFVWINA